MASKTKHKSTANKLPLWLMVGLLVVVLGAPHSLLMRSAVSEIDPFLLNALRFGVVAVIMLPVIMSNRSKYTAKSFGHSVAAGLGLSVAAISFLLALKYSQASYVSMLMMLSPLVLVIYSMCFDQEKATRVAILSVIIALIGSVLLTAAPWILSQSYFTH